MQRVRFQDRSHFPRHGQLPGDHYIPLKLEPVRGGRGHRDATAWDRENDGVGSVKLSQLLGQPSSGFIPVVEYQMRSFHPKSPFTVHRGERE